MPSIDANRQVWDRTWAWTEQGDEWSKPWGGTDAMWHRVVQPRIQSMIPTQTILEIAPGFGRWTQYLKDACERLIAVDLAERCVEHCRERFADAEHVEFHVNDGRSLPMVADASIDFAFSFDSLVHVEADVLDDYLTELRRVLKPDGIGFIHHSNAGAYRGRAALSRRTPKPIRHVLVRRGLMISLNGWRAQSVTTESFAASCERAGLACIVQEPIGWRHRRFLTDTLSVFTPRGSRWERPRRVVPNPRFREQGCPPVDLYAASSFRGAGS